MTTTATPARARPARPSPGRRVVDVALALLAHAAVGASWLAVAASVMGSLDVARRMVMNSEFAWDTGRLPQPWAIPLALVAAWASSLFFGWAMRRARGGSPLWGARVVAWCGALLGVLLGAYLWTPALQVGAQVGPASGQATPWGVLGWAAHHARLALPAIAGLVTAALLVLSRHSPLVVVVKALRQRWRTRSAARRATPGRRLDSRGARG